MHYSCKQGIIRMKLTFSSIWFAERRSMVVGLAIDVKQSVTVVAKTVDLKTQN